jgi:hypothetical protein
MSRNTLAFVVVLALCGVMALASYAVAAPPP